MDSPTNQTAYLFPGNEFILSVSSIKGDEHIMVKANGSELLYHKEKFYSDPYNYISQQIESHRNYKEGISLSLNNFHHELNAIHELESRISKVEKRENSEKGLDELMVDLFIKLFRTTPLRNSFSKIVEMASKTEDSYKSVEKLVNSGREFLECRIAIPGIRKDIQKLLNSCLGLSKDICYLHSCLTNNSSKVLISVKDVYSSLCEESS